MLLGIAAVAITSAIAIAIPTRGRADVAVARCGAHHQVGGDAAGACIEVFADDAAVTHYVILVDVDRFALLGGLDDALACGIVDVVVAVAVVVDFADAVFFIPRDVAARAVDIALPAGLVAIQVVVEGTLADVRGRMRVRSTIAVAPVVAGALLRDDAAIRRGDLVGLRLGQDVVVGVIGQVERVVALLAGRKLVLALGMGEPVEVVVVEALVVGAAIGVGWRHGDIVVEVEDVADHVVLVVEVLEGAGAVAAAGQIIQTAALRIVAVVALDT